MRINKSAGNMEMNAFTDGVPVSITLTVKGQATVRVSYQDLHDLCYICGRIMDAIENEVTNPRHR